MKTWKKRHTEKVNRLLGMVATLVSRVEDAKATIAGLKYLVDVEKEVGGEKDRIIAGLREQNKELHDRLMSRDYPELKRYQIVDRAGNVTEYQVEEDEDISGTLLSEEEMHELSPKG